MSEIIFSQLTPGQLEILIEKSVVRAFQSGSITGNHIIDKDPSDDLLTIKSASEYLHLKIPTLYSLISRGELPVMKKNGRCYFSKAELMEYLKSGKKKTNADLQQEASAYLLKNKNGSRR